jgi:hypothetical protein
VTARTTTPSTSLALLLPPVSVATAASLDTELLFRIGNLAARAAAWVALARPATPLPLATSFRLVLAGNLANLVVPLRGGELARAWLLGVRGGLGTGRAAAVADPPAWQLALSAAARRRPPVYRTPTSSDFSQIQTALTLLSAAAWRPSPSQTSLAHPRPHRPDHRASKAAPASGKGAARPLRPR